ncbi:MAG: hypothetical protein P4L74_03110 [Candidatus Doudnabacteria bacterium]|nr:hypothetical protein [Candidatus Doudnabacteria bacterium]
MKTSTACTVLVFACISALGWSLIKTAGEVSDEMDRSTVGWLLLVGPWAIWAAVAGITRYKKSRDERYLQYTPATAVATPRRIFNLLLAKAGRKEIHLCPKVAHRAH